MSQQSFWNYLSIPVFNSQEKIKVLTQDEWKIKFASSAILLLGFLYTITVIIGYQRGFGAVVPPLLPIPAEEYYFWETFFTIPIFFLGIALFAGVCRWLASVMGGRGSFGDIFAIYAFAMLLPTLLTMWLPETTLIVFFPDRRLTPLGGFDLFPGWVDVARQVLGGLWPLVIAAIGIRISEQLDWFKSILIAVLASLPYIGMVLAFIR